VPFKEDVRAALDELMADAGLPWNSYESPSEHEQYVMYCGDAAGYLAKFPKLGGSGWVGSVTCVDVYVRGADNRINCVDVEGEPLAKVLRRAGLSSDEWDDPDLRITEQLDRLRAVLTRLFVARS
jgi:hypothetical protein